MISPPNASPPGPASAAAQHDSTAANDVLLNELRAQLDEMIANFKVEQQVKDVHT